MTVLIAADLHLSDLPRDEYRHVWQEWLRAQVKHHRVTRVLILGDLTEQKGRHSAQLVNRIVDHMARLAAMCPVTFLRGNHDGFSPDNPFFGFLREIENIDWINDPSSADYPELGRCLFLPHSSRPEIDWVTALEAAYPPRWVFAHATFAGAKGESGRELHGVAQEPLHRFRAPIIAGDVHVPQVIGKVQYVGAPYTIDFGDAYRGQVLLVEGDRPKDKPRQLIYNGPQKMLVDSELLLSGNIGAPQYAGWVVKARVHLRAVDRDRFPDIRRRLVERAGELGLELHSVEPVIAAPDRPPAGTPVPRARKRDDERLIAEYAQRRGLPAATLKTGLRIAKETS